MTHEGLPRVIAVIGAGAMGSGIAQTALAAGLSVVLYDARQDALRSAADRILARLRDEAAKGRVPVEVAQAAGEMLVVAADLSAARSADVVIEAIVEDLEAKRAVFAELETIVSPECVLASNTSSLSIAAIAKASVRPERICGMHFFNPVPLMRLVEIVAGPSTGEGALAMAEALAARLGKTSIRVKDGPGFLVNLGGRAYTTEALHLLQEGAATIEVIDRIMRQGCGFRMGPFELMDLTGIDINLPVTELIHAGYQFDPRLKTTPMHHLMAAAGRYGRKSGRGFHDYSNEPAPVPVKSARPAQAERLPVRLPTRSEALTELFTRGLDPTGDETTPLIVAPLGEDATTAAVRLGADPASVVAIDPTGLGRGFATLMAPPGPNWALPIVRDWLERAGFDVEVIADVPGFVSQRILAMIMNLGCEMAQLAIASPADIDRSMELGLNYPRGPLAMVDDAGAPDVLQTLVNLQAITGSDRYRPSLWLRQRAMLGLSALATR